MNHWYEEMNSTPNTIVLIVATSRRTKDSTCSNTKKQFSLRPFVHLSKRYKPFGLCGSRVKFRLPPPHEPVEPERSTDVQDHSQVPRGAGWFLGLQM